MKLLVTKKYNMTIRNRTTNGLKATPWVQGYG